LYRCRYPLGHLFGIARRGKIEVEDFHGFLVSVASS
jgi:hypothetical protein